MAATLNAGKHFRSWKNDDSMDRSDVERLFDAEKVKTTKSVNCFKYWTVYCTLIGIFFLFLIGILVGFLLRGDTKVTSGCGRKDGFDREKLQAVHNNIVYFMSEENIKTTARELSALSSSSSENIDRVTALYVEKKFRQYGFEDVEVEQQEIVVTSPDPLNPNRLEILSPEGSTKKNITFGTVTETSKGGNLDDPGGFVEFSPGGRAKGPLVYGNYGRDVDYLQLETSLVEMQDAVILLRLGRGTVAEKVKLAQRHGCGGVLLFCYHGDHCNYGDNIHLPVAQDFTDLHEGGLPTIPVQTVSHSVAMDLISSIPGTSLPSHWFQGSLKQVNGSKGEATPNVYLEVNNQKSSQTVYNVIATINGGTESDQQILLGSRRYSSESDLDPGFNTGTLLELGRSMAYIRERELWHPRRTVKFVSYGGHRKHIGQFYYVKNYRHILSQGAVTYIDLDTKSTRLKSMEVRSSISLVNLIWRAADMVPDPSNPEYSLAEKWPKMSHDWYLSNESAVYMYSSGEMPLLQHLGIPSISLYSVHSLLDREKEGKLLQGDISHTSYRLASARVISLTTLKLLDDVILPVNMSYLLQFVNHSISSSLDVLQQHISGLDDKIRKVLTVSGTLAHFAKGFQLVSSDCSEARQINHVLTRFENLFQTESSDENLLSLERQTGTLSVFSEVEERYLITKDRDIVNNILDIFLRVLNEALEEVSAIKTR